MTLPIPQLDLYRVDRSGKIYRVFENVPYSDLLWTKRYSTCGEFQAQLDCDPVAVGLSWPGRYLVAIDGEPEVGVVEKVEAVDSADGQPLLWGRFAESLYDRVRFGPFGGAVRGADWRQAVSSGLREWAQTVLPGWPVHDLVDGPGGYRPQTGQGHVLAGDPGDSAMETLYGEANAWGSWPAVWADWGALRLKVGIRTGTDRTRSQRKNEPAAFGVSLATASKAEYSGDYSTQCSVVDAYAEKGSGADKVWRRVSVPVPGYDPDTMWAAKAYEDVGSLLGQDEKPTDANVRAKGLVRAYDHQAALSVDLAAHSEGYRRWWRLGDLVDVQVRQLALVASARIEEVRLTCRKSGVELEATVGTKQITRVARYAMGRR